MEDIFEDLQPLEEAPKGSPKARKLKQIEIEESLETLSHYLDGVFKIPGVGWRFGLDSLIGLVPNVGDLSTALVSFYILIAGVRYGVPKITLLRMAMNIGLDYVLGIIPVFGDAFDFFWKHNQQNMDLIRERGKGLGTGNTGDWLFVGVILLILLGILAGSVLLSLLLIGFLFKGIYDLFQFI